MKALILRKDVDAACAISRVLIDKGFQILCVETLAVAHALIRVDTIDLLVMDERFDGQLTHSIALSGERRSPYLSVILLTDRDRAETDDLYDLIPCLYALAGSAISPHVLGQLALSAVSNIDEAIARVNRRAAAEMAAFARQDTPAPDLERSAAGPFCADIAIAPPELVALPAPDNMLRLEKSDDALMADIAAIFREQPMPLLLTEPHALAAEMA